MRRLVSFYSVLKTWSSHGPHFCLSFFAGASFTVSFSCILYFGGCTKYFFRGSSNPFLYRKYLRKGNPVFHKIYAHKWLCTAVCGHNIFFVNQCWSRRRDLNTRLLRPEESYKSPLLSEWLFIAVSAPHKILFGSLISVVSMCSKAVYGQLCGHTELLNNKE